MPAPLSTEAVLAEWTEAIAYARYSSANQRAESIDAQLRAIYAYAEKNGIKIIRTYVDREESGTSTENRDEFLRMISDVTKGYIKPKLCLVHKYDRFARDDYDHVVNERRLNQKNVRLIAVDQPLDDSPESELTKTVLVGLAKYFSKNLSRESKKGLKEDALKALHCGGIPPLGYDVIDRRYLINEREAEAVRLIYTMKLNGVGYLRIINELNAAGYKTKRDQPFGKNSIYEILRNEKYTGIFIFDMGEEVIRIPNAIPQIIDYNIWRKVQDIMDRAKKTAPRHRKTMYLLTGKVVCGECGAAYTGNVEAKTNLYTCSARKQKKTCNNKSIRQELLEKFVLDHFESLLNSERVEELLLSIQRAAVEQAEKNEIELKGTKKRLEEISGRLTKLFDALETGAMEAAIAGPRITELTHEKEDLTQRLHELMNVEEVKVDRQQALEFIALNKKILQERDPEECRKIVDTYVHQVTLFQNKIHIQYQLPDTDKLVVPTGFEPVSPP